MGRSEFHLEPYVPNYPPSLTLAMGGLLGQQCWAVLNYAGLRIIPCEQELIVSLGLRLSYLGHQ